MAKRKKKRPFEVHNSPEPISAQRMERFIDRDRGLFGFFRDIGVRETIESVIVAIVLALMFRAYEAEAFIIPTGSMAPALQGQHMDVVCEECQYQYRTQARDGSNNPPDRRQTTVKTFCPICRYGMRMSKKNPDHRSNNGDRILVNKFVYDFGEPKRFDVIVFKNPNNGKQNYIKRCVGIAGDKLYIESGDVFNLENASEPQGAREIIRKPPEIAKVMLQLVDDTNHRSKKMEKAGWPARWKCRDSDSQWTSVTSGDNLTHRLEAGDEFHWLRYRHLPPSVVIWRTPEESRMAKSEWDSIDKGVVPRRIRDSKGELITDFYEYNQGTYEGRMPPNGQIGKIFSRSKAAQWVGDIAFECDMEVNSSSGVLALDLVEGGSHFTCEIDVATGVATLSCKNDATVVFDGIPQGESPTGKSDLRGSGSYKILYAHVDDQLCLWINDNLVKFDSSTYTRGSEVFPMYSPEDPGDAEPAGVAGTGLKGTVTRLKIFRDVYYTSASAGSDNIGEDKPGFNVSEYKAEDWGQPDFVSKVRAMRTANDRVYELGEGQYFPMGDNSPSSLDARVWSGEKFVSDDMLIGQAMFIYWPHSLNKPIKFFPNFKRMGFIK